MMRGRADHAIIKRETNTAFARQGRIDMRERLLIGAAQNCEQEMCLQKLVLLGFAKGGNGYFGYFKRLVVVVCL